MFTFLGWDRVIKLSMSDVWKHFDKLNKVNVQCKLLYVMLNCIIEQLVH